MEENERKAKQRAKWILLTGLLVILSLSSLTAYLLYKQKQLTQARREQIRRVSPLHLCSGLIRTASINPEKRAEWNRFRCPRLRICR